MAIKFTDDYSNLDTALTATANAIRACTGGTATIAFKAATGFADALTDLTYKDRVTFSYSKWFSYNASGNIVQTKSLSGTSVSWMSTIKTITLPYCTFLASETFNYGIFSACTRLFLPACTRIGSSAVNGLYNSSVSIYAPVCTTLDSYAFYGAKLSMVSLPECTSFGGSVFQHCNSLISAYLPKCTSVAYELFGYNYSLTSVYMPLCTAIASYGFRYCSALTMLDFSKVSSIGNYAFYCCNNLVSLYLRSTAVVTLASSPYNVFTSCPLFSYSGAAGKFGNVFVPNSLLNAYKTATNWTVMSSRIAAI